MKKIIIFILSVFFTTQIFSYDKSLEEKMFSAISSNNKAEVERLLKEGYGVNTKGRGKSAPLSQAVYEGNFEISKMLVERGADVNQKDYIDYTPLHEACMMRTRSKEEEIPYYKIAKLLLEHGAKVNARGGRKATASDNLFKIGPKLNQTPLHLAADAGRYETVKLLVEYRADVNAKDYGNTTPLYYAVSHGSPEMVEYLILKGADVNAKSTKLFGDSILHHAACRENIKYVELLIQHGANLQAKSDSGETPYQLAFNTGRKKMAEFLKQAEEEQAKQKKK